MGLLSRKPKWRCMSEPLKLSPASISVAFFFFLLLLFFHSGLFEHYTDPLSIARLKVDYLPSFIHSFEGNPNPSHLDRPPHGFLRVKEEDTLLSGNGAKKDVRLNLGTRRPTCNTNHPRTDVCEMEGDVRVDGRSLTVDFYLPDFGGRDRASWHVKAFPRKNDVGAMNRVNAIRVREVGHHSLVCQVNHSHPGLVFSTGGYLGNVYHDFSDSLLPLFLTAHRFSGNVHFLVINYNNIWFDSWVAEWNVERKDVPDEDRHRLCVSKMPAAVFPAEEGAWDLPAEFFRNSLPMLLQLQLLTRTPLTSL